MLLSLPWPLIVIIVWVLEGVVETVSWKSNWRWGPLINLLLSFHNTFQFHGED